MKVRNILAIGITLLALFAISGMVTADDSTATNPAANILCTTSSVSVPLTGTATKVVAAPYNAAAAGTAGVACYQQAKASCENLKPPAPGQPNGTMVRLEDQCHRYCGALQGNQAKCTIYKLAPNSASASCTLSNPPSQPSTANLSQAVQNTVTTGGVNGSLGNVSYSVGYNHNGGAASVSCTVTGTATATCECYKSNNQGQQN